jgi:AraC-like DNA-binding protein
LLPKTLRHSLTEPGFAGVHRSHPEIGEVVSALYREHHSRDSYSADACRSLSELLITSLARSAGNVQYPNVSHLVSQAQGALLEADEENCSVEAVAERLFVSTAWLTKKFRSEVGQTPAAWVLERKMANAKRLLGMTDEPITDIAFQLGFSSSQYFATAFRRVTGRSPSEYRSLVFRG